MLLTKKMLVTFIVGFLLVVLPGLVGLFDNFASLAAEGDLNFDVSAWGTLLAGLISGGIAAGIRALIAIQPVNIVPTDSLHGPGHTPGAVLVTKGTSEERP